MVISSRLSNFSIDVTLLWPLFNMWKSTCNGIMRCNIIILQWATASFVTVFLDGDAIHVLSSLLTHASNWNKTNTAMLTKHFLERLLGLVLFNGINEFSNTGNLSLACAFYCHLFTLKVLNNIGSYAFYTTITWLFYHHLLTVHLKSPVRRAYNYWFVCLLHHNIAIT